jgi:hypothetical protein
MKKILLILGFGVVLTGFFGCDLGGNNMPSAPAAAILFATLSPDAPNADIYVGSSTAVSNMPYARATNYSQIVPGRNTIRITNAGGTPGIVTDTINVQEGYYYSLFLIDSVKRMKLALVKDELATVSSDSVRIRFFNFSPNAPAVDLLTKSGDSIFVNRTFNDQSATSSLQKFTKIKKGTYVFSVKQSHSSTTLVDSMKLDLVGGGNYTLFLKGFLGGTQEKAVGLGNMRNM